MEKTIHPPEPPKPVNLGSVVVDQVTGFQGVVTELHAVLGGAASAKIARTGLSATNEPVELWIPLGRLALAQTN